MKVIVINEESHGFIGLAKDMISAFDFLVNENWVTENDFLLDENDDPIELKKTMERLNLSLRDTLCHLWYIDENYFDGFLYFEEKEIYGME